MRVTDSAVWQSAVWKAGDWSNEDDAVVMTNSPATTSALHQAATNILHFTFSTHFFFFFFHDTHQCSSAPPHTVLDYCNPGACLRVCLFLNDGSDMMAL